MTEWMFFPKSDTAPKTATDIVGVFDKHNGKIASENHTLESNEVLAHIAEDIRRLGFEVESGKKKAQRISVPVLYGRNGQVEKYFQVDAFHPGERWVLEVEAGRATINHQFLKDLFEACMMPSVDYCAIAVRSIYTSAGRRNPDFERVVTFFETLHASNRLRLPLKGVLIVGY
jgi:hypothetical protein